MPDRVSREHLIERLHFRRAPLAAAALWFAAGILLAHANLHETIHLVLALGFCGAIALAATRNRLGWLAVAGVWISLGAAAGEWQRAPPSQTALLAYADNLSRTVRAHVVRIHVPPPEVETKDSDQVPSWELAEDTSLQRGQPITLDLSVDEIEEVTPDRSTMIPISGGVRVSVYESVGLAPHCGEKLELPLRLKPPERFRTPGAFDYGAYLLAEQGIAAHATVAGRQIRTLEDLPPTARCRLFAAQSWASQRLVGLAESADNLRLPGVLRLTQADALMLNAMLFGDRTGLTHALRIGFERTGTFHLFVVSGLHITLVATGLFWLLRKSLAPAWLATFLTLAGSTAYALLTGFGQPAQRALAMTVVFLIARLLTRDRDALNALGAAVLAMLVLAPSSLFDASFQMTVLVIVAIAGIAVPLARRTPVRHKSVTRLVFQKPRRIFVPRSAQMVLMLELWGETIARVLPLRWSNRARKLPAWVVRVALQISELALISFIAELIMVLPMAVYFHRMPVFAVPANILILPLIGVLVPAALVTFAASLLGAKLALLPALVTSSILHAITFAIRHLSTLSAADQRIPAPPAGVVIGAIFAWLACCWLVRRNSLGTWITAALLPLIAVCLLLPERAITHPGDLEITALDVGQGDSILAINPEGATMLIDAGGPVGSHGSAETVSSFDLGEEVVAPYLWSRRLRRLDVLVLSHAHTDHMGGMPAILADLRPRELWVGVDPVSPLYKAMLAEAARLNIPVRHVHAGDHSRWGSVDIDVLAPAPGYVNLSSPKNDDSVVLHLQYGKATVLLEGDAERPSEDAMLLAHRIQPVTLLKVGHHGSKTSSNPEFLAAAQPRNAVISVGRHNTFGHPRAEVIQRFAEAGTRLFRTDNFGLTTFLLTSDGQVHVSSP